MSTAESWSEPPPLKGARLMIVGFGLALANFIVVLDTSIANVAVPHIAGGLGISPNQGTWVITSYAVSDAISVPLTGWLARRFGSVRTFIGCLIGFGIFSALCGMAWSLGMLVLFRVLQGASGGPLMPLTQTLMLRIFPKEKAATALTVWSMTTVAAPILGPIFGGAITDNWSWPWIFFINLPVVAVCVGSAIYSVRPFETPIVRQRVDLIGLALLVIWVGAFQVTIDFGREMDWFSSPFVCTTAIVALIGFAAFVIWELTESDPVVDLSVFRNRGFTIGASTLAMGYATMFATIVLVPLWLQSVVGYTATDAGHMTAPAGVFAIAFSPLVARLATRVDIRALVCGGMMWLGLVSLLRSQWTADADAWTYALPQLLQGAGMPFFFIGLTSLALSSVSGKETASAAGVMSFMRTASGAFGASLAQTYWDHASRTSRANIVGQLNAPETLTDTYRNLGLSADQARNALDRLVETQASTVALNHVFITGAVLFAAAAMFVWIAPRPRRLSSEPAH